MISPIIEVYFAPGEKINDKAGAFRARLEGYHPCSVVGSTPEEAVEALFQKVRSLRFKAPYVGLPDTIEGFAITRLDPLYFVGMPGPWNQRDEAAEADAVRAAGSSGCSFGKGFAK